MCVCVCCCVVLFVFFFQSYLLEKTRVTSPTKGERDFHIFYQLLQGMSLKDLKKIHLDPNPKFFKILNKSDVFVVRTLDDKTEYVKTMKAMKVIGFGKHEILEVKKTLAAILWLGQVVFKKKKEPAVIEDMEPVDIVAGFFFSFTVIILYIYIYL